MGKALSIATRLSGIFTFGALIAHSYVWTLSIYAILLLMAGNILPQYLSDGTNWYAVKLLVAFVSGYFSFRYIVHIATGMMIAGPPKITMRAVFITYVAAIGSFALIGSSSLSEVLQNLPAPAWGFQEICGATLGAGLLCFQRTRQRYDPVFNRSGRTRPADTVVGEESYPSGKGQTK